jgi:hypothetical protein
MIENFVDLIKPSQVLEEKDILSAKFYFAYFDKVTNLSCFKQKLFVLL